MKLNHILKEIQNTTPEAFERTENRRDILKNFGAKVAAATIPLALASTFKAKAKTTDVLSEAIHFALTATEMLIAFYEKAFASNTPIPADRKADFVAILNHTKAHRKYWYGILTSTGNPLPTAVTYDFTAKNNAFPNVFTKYGDFLTLAHTLEDVGVRIYEAAIQDLVTNKALRGDAINMRCTMARHAAHIRLLRRNENIDMMPWVTGSDGNTIVGELLQGYQGEEITMQGKFEIVNLNGANISMKAATQAFDEPMGILVAQAFQAHFIV